jgi:hypothetical protein
MAVSRAPTRPTLTRCLIGSLGEIAPAGRALFRQAFRSNIMAGGTLLSPEATAEDLLAGFVHCTKCAGSCCNNSTKGETRSPTEVIA